MISEINNWSCDERETEYGLREYIKKHSYLYFCTLKNIFKHFFDGEIFEKVSELI